MIYSLATFARTTNTSFGVALAAAALLISAGTASANEFVTVRSGQVGGLPGTVGQSDDIVRRNPTTVPGAPLSASAFTAADFAGAVSGPAAVVINPVPFAWTPGISDTSARWINYQADLQVASDGSVSGSGFGLPGSVLYAVPFTVTTPGATQATLSLEYAVDDCLGDFIFGGANTSGLFVNGVNLNYSNYGFNAPYLFTATVPVSTGLNYLYFYQRDVNFGAAGIIFSATFEVPAPGAAALLGLSGLVATRRRRR